MAGCDSEVVKAAFKKFDKDNNGLITYDELEAVFKEIGGFANDEELRKIIASVSQSAGRWSVSGDIPFLYCLLYV